MRFVLYLIRWQLSTPILAIAAFWFADLGHWWASVLANLIGGCIFYYIDRTIFNNRKERK